VPAFVTPIDHNPVVTSLWLTPLYLGSGMILMGVLNGVPDNHTTRSLGFVGRHSYGIYLWHVLVTETLWHYGIQNDAVVWIAQALSVAIGVLMSELVELPMLRIREWITTKSPASL
jgi:peptidoglycan/LPS O-acetylase OafA/YrhL